MRFQESELFSEIDHDSAIRVCAKLWLTLKVLDDLKVHTSFLAGLNELVL